MHQAVVVVAVQELVELATQATVTAKRMARSHFTTGRIRRFPTFALCRRLPPFAGLWCTERARKGPRGLHLTRNVAFWDAMILASCLDAGVKVLYSEDLPGGDVEGLSVVNPFK